MMVLDAQKGRAVSVMKGESLSFPSTTTIMPMPKLLKRFSRKSLKNGKSKSLENLRSDSSEPGTPPPVPLRSPLSDGAYPSPPMSPQLQLVVPTDELSKSLAGTWQELNKEHKISKTDKVLQVLGVYSDFFIQYMHSHIFC